LTARLPFGGPLVRRVLYLQLLINGERKMEKKKLDIMEIIAPYIFAIGILIMAIVFIWYIITYPKPAIAVILN